MTKTLTLRAFDIPSVHKFGIGFDNMFDSCRLTEHQGNYPPYNIIKLSANLFKIELAVAGFTESEIEIEVEKNKLMIRGNKAKDVDKVEYLVKNIANREFNRIFTLAEYVEVVTANMADGILSISLEQKIPDQNLPKRIAISSAK
jgi:molecular chaperone IbpA